MGALGRTGCGGNTNTTIKGILWSCRSGFGTYGRGNFPGHHVLGCLGKMVWMDVDGCVAGWMGANGSIGKKGRKNKGKSALNKREMGDL